MKYGRLAARRPVGLRDLTAYAGGPLPSAPPQVTPPSVADWGMYGNDQFGDCTAAGVVHLRMANAAEHAETETFPTEQEVVAEYFALSGGQDTGLVEADVLQTWQTTGLWGNKIVGYAPVDHRNQAELRSVVAAFGASYLGVAMPAPAQGQFAAGQPWDLTSTSADRQIEGGHCIVLAGYDDCFGYVVTWGALQRATWRWLATYLEEAWAVLSSEDDRVDDAALRADLAALAQRSRPSATV